MKEKQAVTKQLALECKRARKKKKGKILDTVVELSGYNPNYLTKNEPTHHLTTLEVPVILWFGV